jgi:hypothetical protein
VGLQLPSELAEPLRWTGLAWPEADEELLFEAGEQWIAFGEQLHAAAQAADGAAERVWTADSGSATDAFRQWWVGADGPDRRLLEDAAAAVLIGAALVAFAVLTLALKTAFIAQLSILLSEVSRALATAVATSGATTAEIPAAVAATRMTCRRQIDQVVSQVQTGVREILGQARSLLTPLRTEARAASPEPRTGFLPPHTRRRRPGGLPADG